jgi:adenylate cyclase
MATRRTPRLRERAIRTDANPDLVASAKLIRRLLPGEMSSGDDLPAARDQLPERLGRQLSDLTPERPSVMREVGLAALQAWQALSESQRRRRGTSDTAILFTDLVGFSSWALDAGDEAAKWMATLRNCAPACISGGRAGSARTIWGWTSTSPRVSVMRRRAARC